MVADQLQRGAVVEKRRRICGPGLDGFGAERCGLADGRDLLGLDFGGDGHTGIGRARNLEASCQRVVILRMGRQRGERKQGYGKRREI